MALVQWLPIGLFVFNPPRTPWPHDLPFPSTLPNKGPSFNPTPPHFQGGIGSHTCSLAGLGVDFSHFSYSSIVTSIECLQFNCIVLESGIEEMYTYPHGASILGGRERQETNNMLVVIRSIEKNKTI